ncbi:MAG: exonuclease domain-containing protein [Phycisphaerales bacterium]|nr:exonuclease domain-containing protein [Phycisphaerales bacterium]
MNFTAIDFETANSYRGSACAVGLAVVKDGQIVGRFHSLIRPVPCKFDLKNVSIHGITEKDVADAPTFVELWPTLQSRIFGPLVAHNALFDMGVLQCACDDGKIEYPKVECFCTMDLSRLAWPEQPKHALDHIAEMLGISFKHHHAEEDAMVCSLIAIDLCKRHNISTLYDLEKLYGCGIVHVLNDGPHEHHLATGHKSIWNPSWSAPKAADIHPTRTQFNKSHPFFGKSFVFTGAMSRMNREDAMQAVVDRGGICHDQIKKTTDFLVIGQDGYAEYEAGHKSGKLRKAEEYREKGCPIKIVSEQDFASLL